MAFLEDVALVCLVTVGLAWALPPGSHPLFRETSCPQVDPMNYTVMLPYPGNCSMFYMCANGVAVPMNCPSNLYFNADLMVCDWPDHSGCVQPSWQCPPPSAEEPWRDTFPYPGNCSMFYLCWQGVATAYSCDYNLYFNANLSTCDIPEHSGCVNPRWQCPPPSRDEPWRNNYPYPGNCSRFYTCVDNVAYQRYCPSGLNFNNATEECDWPAVSGCQSDIH